MRKKQTTARSAICLVMIMLLISLSAGCGGEVSEEPGEDRPGEPAAPADSDPVQQGGQITIPIVDDPLFNPHHPRHYVESVMITRILFPGLTRLDDDMTPGPALAAGWDVSEDGLTWTFYLADAVWHDGEPFTADDVRFTFMDVVLDEEQGSAVRNNFSMVEDVEVVDEQTVRFHLNNPSASLAACLGYNAGILPVHILGDVEDINSFDEFNKRNPVGTGPFKLKEYVAGQFVTLVANEDFFGDAPLLDAIHYKILPDPNTQVAQVLSGELDLMIVDNPANVPKLSAANHVQIVQTPQVNYFFLAPNTTRDALGDKRVRQAMMYALDREAMVANIMKEYAQPATGPISPALSYFYNPDVKTYSYDPDEAKQLLEQSGWIAGSDGIRVRDGQRLELTITVPRVQVHEQVGTLAQQYFKDVGIDITLEALEFNTFIADRLVPRTYDILGGWWVSPPDPDVFNYFHSSSAERGNNVPMFADSELDRLLVLGRETSDQEQRQQIYFEIQQLLAEEVPYLFLWYPQELMAINSRVKGIVPIAFRDALQHAEKIYIEQ